MPTFPVTAPNCLNVIQGGARIYHADYTANGVEFGGTFTYLGQVQAGGVTINLQREEGLVDGEEGRAPCDVFITKEQWLATFNLLEGDRERTNILVGAEPGNSPAFSGNQSSMSLGGVHVGGGNSGKPQVYQLAIESPNETDDYDNFFLGFWLVWRAIIKFNGELNLSRDTSAVLPTQIMAMWDHSVPITEGARGALGKKITTSTIPPP